MTISLIAAASTNHAIGHLGMLPWKLPNDMLFFKNTTWAMPVIMGRKTYDALGKPLPGRSNFIVSQNANLSIAGVTIAASIQAAIAAASNLSTKEIFIIGGGKIYQQSMAIANRIYLTRVHTLVKEADAFFPEIDSKIWKLVSQTSFLQDDKHAFNYDFELWERKPEQPKMED